MATFEKFDPHAFLGRQPQPSLAGLATLAGEDDQFANAVTGTKQGEANSDHCEGSGDCRRDPAKLAKAAKVEAQSAPGAVLSLADCLERLTELHVELRAGYVEGAVPWAFERVPGLVQRFHETEASIDRLASTGPTEAAFRSALAAHRGVWRELVARYRAHRDAVAERADPMPELPEDTTVAIGFSYGDGEPGTWNTVAVIEAATGVLREPQTQQTTVTQPVPQRAASAAKPVTVLDRIEATWKPGELIAYRDGSQLVTVKYAGVGTDGKVNVWPNKGAVRAIPVEAIALDWKPDAAAVFEERLCIMLEAGVPEDVARTRAEACTREYLARLTRGGA